MIKKILVAVSVVHFLAFGAIAQEGLDPFSGPLPSADQIVQEEGLCEGCISFDFQGADIRNVLQILSYKSGINMVVDPEVTGLITIQLTNVPWEDALSVILNTYGYGYEKKGNIITVTTIEKLKVSRQNALSLADQELIETKAFSLNYATASEAIASIEKMLTPRGSVNFDQRTNTIIVRDTASNINQVSEVISRLDAPTQQVLIEARIIKTTLGDNEKLGIDWGVAAKGVQVTAASVGKQGPISFGTDPFTFGTVDFTGLQAMLEILKTRSNTEILSNPRIVTLNNQKARISVGEQYPFPQYTYNEESDRLQISGYDYKDIGIIFEVTPYVNNVGMITLHVEPKVTARGDTLTESEGGIKLPVLSIEEASTRVMIKDGQTLVIAGLIRDELKNTKKKIPLLGDIPLLGLAFQHNQKELTKTELLIFITPHILEENHSDQVDLLEEKTKGFKGK